MVAGYSCVHVGKSLLWAGEDALALYVMVRFLALPPAAAGSMFLLSSVWNALCDGLFGWALRRSVRLRQAAPRIAAIAIPVSAASFAALPLAATHSLGWAALLLLLFRTGFSLADVPHNGLTRMLATNDRHLAAARIRAIGSGGAALTIGVASTVLLAAGGEGRTVAIVLSAAIAVAALVLMAPLPFLLTRAPDDAPVAPAAKRDDRAERLAFRLFCLATMLGLAGMGASGKALLHLHIAGGIVGPALLLLVTAGRLGAVWIWSPLARRTGNHRALALAYAGCAVAALLIPAFGRLPAVCAGAVLLWFGVSGGGVALLSWAVLTMTIGADDKRDAARFTAGFGLFTMTMKLALGLSAALVGLWLTSWPVPAGIPSAAFWPLAISAACGSGLASAILLRAVTAAGEPDSNTVSPSRPFQRLALRSVASCASDRASASTPPHA